MRPFLLAAALLATSSAQAVDPQWTKSGTFQQSDPNFLVCRPVVQAVVWKHIADGSSPMLAWTGWPSALEPVDGSLVVLKAREPAPASLPAGPILLAVEHRTPADVVASVFAVLKERGSDVWLVSFGKRLPTWGEGYGWVAPHGVERRKFQSIDRTVELRYWLKALKRCKPGKALLASAAEVGCEGYAHRWETAFADPKCELKLYHRAMSEPLRPPGSAVGLALTKVDFDKPPFLVRKGGSETWDTHANRGGWVTTDPLNLSRGAPAEPGAPLRVLKRTDPKFPNGADPSGDCVAEVAVDAWGYPKTVDVTGCADPFVSAVQEAVSTWRWESPAGVSGDETSSVTLRFKFRDN